MVIKKKKFKALDGGNLSLSEQLKLAPAVTKKKYQVKFQLRNKRIRYAYLDNPKVIEVYLCAIGAKILNIKRNVNV